MRVSYKSHPILEKLEKQKLGVLTYFEKDKPFFNIHAYSYSRNWEFYSEYFKKELNYISIPFYEAALKCEAKLRGLWFDILTNDLSDYEISGTFIQGPFVYMIYYSVKQDQQNQEVVIYKFSKDGMPLMMYIDSYEYKIHQNGWIYYTTDNIKLTKEDIDNQIWSEISKLVVFDMFKKYAQVETKFLPAGKIIKDIKCKYFNDTKLNIQYLDSKWFTNLVKSDGFNVRGHFRLQPKKKDGEWTKELIWINDFQKEGYTAPARKLSINT